MVDKTTQNDVEVFEKKQAYSEEFGCIYREWVVPIYRYIYARVRNPQDAEDTTSEVFLAAMQALPHYEDRGHLSAWLFGIARNKLREYFRKKWHKETSFEFHSEKILGRTGRAVEDEISIEIKVLNQCIYTLPEAEQELILLRYVAELKFSEIGHVVKKSEGAVKKKIYRIQNKLRKMMEHEND